MTTKAPNVSSVSPDTTTITPDSFKPPLSKVNIRKIWTRITDLEKNYNDETLKITQTRSEISTYKKMLSTKVFVINGVTVIKKDITLKLNELKKQLENIYKDRNIATATIKKFTKLLTKDKYAKCEDKPPKRTLYVNDIDKNGVDCGEYIKERKNECRNKKRIANQKTGNKRKQGKKTDSLRGLNTVCTHNTFNMAIEQFLMVFHTALDWVNSKNFCYNSQLQFVDVFYFMAFKGFNNVSDDIVTQEFKTEYLAYVTPKAFAKKRDKIDHSDMRVIFEYMLSYITNDIKRLTTRTEKVIDKLYSMDGSSLNYFLEFADANFKVDKNNRYTFGLINTVYDVANQVPVNVIVTENMSERKAAIEQIKSLPQNIVMLADGGYFSLELHQVFKENNIDYIMRIPATFKFCNDFKNSSQKTLIVDNEYGNIRLIKRGSGDNIQVIGTTLLDKKQYSDKTILESYDPRWSVEEFYKIMKCILNINKSTDTKYNRIMQNIYTQLIVVLIEKYLEFIGKHYLDQVNNSTYHTVNKKNAFRIIVNKVLRKILFDDKDVILKFIFDAIFDIINTTTRIVDDRVNKRERKLPHTEYNNHSIT